MSIASPVTAIDLATMLRADIHGDVVTADEAAFAAASFGVDRAGGHPPEVIVIAADAADVAAAVRIGVRTGRRVTVQTPGQPVVVTAEHSILLVTRLLARVRIDADARTATVGAGSTWRQVTATAQGVGLTAVSAPVPGVGAIGYGPGRGVGPVARAFGFAVDLVRSFQVVTPTGDVREIDARSDPRRFAELRRGAGSGIVTALIIELLPADQIFAADLWFATEDAPAVRRGWDSWVGSLPTTAASSITRMDLPETKQLPADLRGRSMMRVRFVHRGSAAVGQALVEPLQAAAPTQLIARRDSGR